MPIPVLLGELRQGQIGESYQSLKDRDCAKDIRLQILDM
jgi:hypothetical protein